MDTAVSQHRYLDTFLIKCDITCKKILLDIINWLNEYGKTSDKCINVFYTKLNLMLESKILFVKNNFFNKHELTSYIIIILQDIITKSNKVFSNYVDDFYKILNEVLKIVENSENDLLIYLFDKFELYSNITNWFNKKSNTLFNVPKYFENIISNKYEYIGSIWSLPIKYEKLVLDKSKWFGSRGNNVDFEYLEEIEQKWAPTVVTTDKKYAELVNKYYNSKKIIEYKNNKSNPITIHKITASMNWPFPLKLINFADNYPNSNIYIKDKNPCIPGINNHKNIECRSILPEFVNSFDLILYHAQMKKFNEVYY